MDFGLGIKMMWPLAAHEAAAGESAELEPGHILCGLLKLAEMPASFLRDSLPDKELGAVLEEDQRELCKTLEGSGICVPDDSTRLRRGLRSLLRKRDLARAENRSGVMHRSTASKALFARAEAAAREAGEKEIGAARLVEMLLSNPDEALAAALAQIGNIRIDARAAAGKATVAWIDDYGCDLTGRAREDKSGHARVETIRRDAVCCVLAGALFGGPSIKTPPALLISRGERRAAAVVTDLALWLVSSKPPPGVRGACILEIHSAAILSREATGSSDARLVEVFRRAASCKNTVLFFDDFHRYLTPSIAGEGLARRLQALLNVANISCVMGVTQRQYETHLERAASWRKAFRLIWIHDSGSNFQL